MFTARLSFPKRGRDAESAAEAAFDWIATRAKNGQIVGESPLVDAGETIDAYVTIPERDALDPANDNVYASKDREREGFPRVAVLGPDPGLLAACGCATRSGLVLFTRFADSITPPVRCLDCWGPVPLYRLPHVDDHEHLVILQWAADYRACDTLQMHCTTGERFGERQLERHDGSLARNGRELAAALERRSGRPVYYFLLETRSRGRAAELARRCPACGAAWRLEERLHLFDLRCDPCRLLSAIAADVP